MKKPTMNLGEVGPAGAWVIGSGATDPKGNPMMIAVWAGMPLALPRIDCECGQRLRFEEREFDYTTMFGIDPSEGTLVLRGIPVGRCQCGEMPFIPAMDPLHKAIAIVIQREHLTGSWARAAGKAERAGRPSDEWVRVGEEN